MQSWGWESCFLLHSDEVEETRGGCDGGMFGKD
jgi:hypothetical protein